MKPTLPIIIVCLVLMFCIGIDCGRTQKPAPAPANPTNLVVASNYAGTIQVDDHYWTRAELKSQEWSQYSTDIKHLDAKIAYFQGVEFTFRALEKNHYIKTNAYLHTNAMEIETNILIHEP